LSDSVVSQLNAKLQECYKDLVFEYIRASRSSAVKTPTKEQSDALKKSKYVLNCTCEIIDNLSIGNLDIALIEHLNRSVNPMEEIFRLYLKVQHSMEHNSKPDFEEVAKYLCDNPLPAKNEKKPTLQEKLDVAKNKVRENDAKKSGDVIKDNATKRSVKEIE